MLFLSPATLFLLLFYAYPMLLSIRLSFYDVSWGQKTFVGLQNFQAVLREGYLLNSTIVTLKFFIALMLVTQVLAFLVAYWLSGFSNKFQGFTLTLYSVAGVFGAVTTVVIWRWIFRYPDGLLNNALRAISLPGIAFLGNPTTSAWSVALAMAGATMAGSMILWLAAMGQVPREVIEAARLDGAGSIRVLTNIIAPLTGRMRLYMLITGFIGAAHIWEHPYFFTGGGPVGSSSTLMYRVYSLAFEERKIGEGMALTVIMMIVVTLIAAAFLKRLRDVLE